MTEFILASKKEVVPFSSFQEIVKQNIFGAYFTGFYFWFRLWVSKFVYLVNILLFLVKLPFVSIGTDVYTVIQVIQIFLITSWGAILSSCIWPPFLPEIPQLFSSSPHVYHSFSWHFLSLFWFWDSGKVTQSISSNLSCRIIKTEKNSANWAMNWKMISEMLKCGKICILLKCGQYCQ